MQNQEYNADDFSAPSGEQLSEPTEKPIDALANPTPDNPPWNSWTALGIWVASIVFIGVVPLFLLIPYLVTSGVNLNDKEALTNFVLDDPTAVLLQLSGTIPAHLLTLLLAWAVVTRLKKFSFWKTLGWSKGGFVWWHYLVIMAGILFVLYTVSYFFPEQDNQLIRLMRSSHGAVLVIAFLATFTAPLTEEVVYRGVLYSAFQRTFGVPIAVVFVTLVFAGVHFYQYWGSPSTIFLICFLSLVLTLVRVKAKSILPCFILHTLINGTQSIFSILQTFVLPHLENGNEQNAALIRFFNSIFY